MRTIHTNQLKTKQIYTKNPPRARLYGARLWKPELLVSFMFFLVNLFSFPVYSAEVDLLAEIEPTLQVVVPTSVSLNLTPNLDGSPVFVSKDLEILVATNNPTGYHLSLQTNSTNLTNNVKDKDGNYPILETISSELSEENFTTNRWGYKYNTENYLPFQTNINLNQTTSPTNKDNITLTFAAKADITKPAGTYSLALNFQAVTNYVPYNYLGQAVYMQNLTTEQCEKTDDGQTATLIDIRDGNTYTVAKINGNCWMTENLRIGGGTELTPKDSNIVTNWTIPENTTISLTKSEPKMHEPSENEIVTSNLTARELGNWYNYCAATAGTVCADATDAEDEAEYDICPKSWRLPTYEEQLTLAPVYPSFSMESVEVFSPVAAGGCWRDICRFQGENGYYWSSTVLTSGEYLDHREQLMYTVGSGLTVGGAHAVTNGLSIRCILK